ncbi:putative Split AAA-ATPase protein PA0787 [Burkholderia ambifaria]
MGRPRALLARDAGRRRAGDGHGAHGPREPEARLRVRRFRLCDRSRPAGAEPFAVRARSGGQARMHLGRRAAAPVDAAGRPAGRTDPHAHRVGRVADDSAAGRELRQHDDRVRRSDRRAGDDRGARADPLVALLRPFPDRRTGAGPAVAYRHPYAGAGGRRRRSGRRAADDSRNRRRRGTRCGDRRRVSRRVGRDRQSGRPRPLRRADAPAGAVAAARRRRTVRRHAALPAARGRVADAAAAGADGAERTGDEPASRSAAGAWPPDRAGRAAFAGAGRVACGAAHRDARARGRLRIAGARQATGRDRARRCRHARPAGMEVAVALTGTAACVRERPGAPRGMYPVCNNAHKMKGRRFPVRRSRIIMGYSAGAMPAGAA